MKQPTTEQTDTIVSVLLAREDLAELLQHICEDFGFELNDLLGKSPEEFGDQSTPSIIKNLRYRNFEEKRVKRLVRVLTELRNKQIEVATVKTPKLHSPLPPRKLSHDPSATTQRLKIAHENAAVNFILAQKERVRKLKVKEKAHQAALLRLEELKEARRLKQQEQEEKRKQLLDSRKQHAEHLELRHLKKPRNPLMSAQSSSSKLLRITRREELDNSEEKLQQITQRVNAGRQRSEQVYNERAEHAAKFGNYAAALESKRRQHQEADRAASERSQAIYNNIQAHLFKREQSITSSVNRLRQQHQKKWERLEAFNSHSKSVMQARERRMKAREAEQTEKLARHQQERNLQLSVNVEKNRLKKINQIDKLREDDLQALKKRQRIIEKAKHTPEPPSLRSSHSPLLQDLIAMTKLNSNKILAGLRADVV